MIYCEIPLGGKQLGRLYEFIRMAKEENLRQRYDAAMATKDQTGCHAKGLDVFFSQDTHSWMYSEFPNVFNRTQMDEKQVPLMILLSSKSIQLFFQMATCFYPLNLHEPTGPT